MTKTLRTLLIEDSEDDAKLLTRELKKGTYKPVVKRVETPTDMKNALQKEQWDVIISDYKLPQFNGFEALKLLKETKQDLPFIVVSGKIGEETAVKIMKAGAHDYIKKENLFRLNPAITRELEDAHIRRERKKAEKDLKKSYTKLQQEIKERKTAEKNAREAQEYLQNVIDSASEIIISVNNNNRITTWNKTTEELTGYPTKEVHNRSINKLNIFDTDNNILDYIKTVYKEKRPGYENFVLTTKDNSKKIIRVTGSPITGKVKQPLGVILIGEDITQDIEIHGRLLKGNTYLITDTKNNSALDLYADLTTQEYNGLLITRATPHTIKDSLPQPQKSTICLFSDQKKYPYNTINTLDELTKKITEFSKKQTPLILLDGIHYLITKNTFQEFINTLYQIHDLITINNALLLIRIDPTMFTDAQRAIIENEIQPLPSQKIEGLVIQDEVYHTLKYIHEQNQQNALVPIKKIMAKFHISYSTAAKRIEQLEKKGLTFTKRQGKLRTVYATDKGKTLLHKRQTA